MKENITKKQMEMGLETAARANCRRRSQQRKKRAQWWFHQMRTVVNSAIDWKPAPEAPEPRQLALIRGE